MGHGAAGRSARHRAPQEQPDTNTKESKETMSEQPHITQLRAHLLDTLTALRDRTNPLDVERARAIAQVAGVLVDSAKAEVEFLRVTGQDSSEFMQTRQGALPAPGATTTEPGAQGSGIVSITRHALR